MVVVKVAQQNRPHVPRPPPQLLDRVQHLLPLDFIPASTATSDPSGITTRYEQVKYDRRITQKTASVAGKVWGGTWRVGARG